MKMEKEMMYVAPAVEVLEVEIELGFAGSPDPLGPGSGGGTVDPGPEID